MGSQGSLRGGGRAQRLPAAFDHDLRQLHAVLRPLGDTSSPADPGEGAATTMGTPVATPAATPVPMPPLAPLSFRAPALSVASSPAPASSDSASRAGSVRGFGDVVEQLHALLRANAFDAATLSRVAGGVIPQELIRELAEREAQLGMVRARKCVCVCVRACVHEYTFACVRSFAVMRGWLPAAAALCP